MEFSMLFKIKKLFESGFIYFHGDMFGIENDAVLVVIHIGRILHIPLLTCKSGGDKAQSLTSRSARVALVALVLRAKQTLGVSALRQELCRRDSLGVLLGLGEIYGDVNLTVFALVFPLKVLGNTVGAYVITCAAEIVEIICRELGGNSVI